MLTVYMSMQSSLHIVGLSLALIGHSSGAVGRSGDCTFPLFRDDITDSLLGRRFPTFPLSSGKHPTARMYYSITRDEKHEKCNDYTTMK